LGQDEKGRTRILLNNKFVFQVGALDQGYWPDGIYTAPTDAALKYDIEIAKTLGFNLLRKHAKVEPQRWYYWCDRLGMLVWQDMPQAFGDLNDDAKAQWMTEWKREIATHSNHPSIIVWTTFNEGWGENTFDVPGVVALTKQLDPTRLVNNASGWTDKGVGDFHDTHAYPGPWSEKPEPTRAAVNGEFGGVTMRVPGHIWTTGEVMGYGATLQEGRLVTKRYQQLLKTGYDLMESQGTSALVYTQLTDVEQEINGLLTYDRAVIKPDIAIIAAANKGQFLPLPPSPHPDLVPTSEEDAQTWRYTTDKPSDSWMQTSFDDTAWKSGPAPFGHDMGGVNTQWTGADIWIRREVTLPETIPADLVILVKHDEDAEIYVNGVLAGSVTGYAGEYVSVPMNAAGRAALKPGKNVLAAHCHNTVGGQGIDVGIAQAPAKP
ncbi:MAG: glycoside hydrolase family 2, partial [Armatimonadota bacterium]|nr:glycoside hydrolase family 2 [Armatimonadota bacterium]